MLIEVLNVVVLLGSGVTAGVLFGISLAVVPALAAMSPGRYVETHRLIGQHWDPMMPIIVLSSALVDVILAVLAGGGTRSLLYIIGAALMLGVACVSHVVNVPINMRTRGMDPAEIPDDWQDPRALWRNWNLVRAALAATALTVSSIALALG